MEREDLCGRVRSTGPWFEERLKTLGDLPIVSDVRGSHFMLCVESVRDRTSKEPFGDDIEIGKRIARNTQSRGLIVRPIGNLNILSPALAQSRDEIDRIVAILRDAIEDTMAELDREGFDFAAQAGSLGPENGTRPAGLRTESAIREGRFRSMARG